MPEKKYIIGTGRRKTAIARVFLTKKSGEAMVNSVPIEDYFSDLHFDQQSWKRPFNLLSIANPTKEYDLSIRVSGSGKSAQMEAVIHGISWALASESEAYAETLRKNGMLTRDSRMVERKKYWLRKARKSPQYSKR